MHGKDDILQALDRTAGMWRSTGTMRADGATVAVAGTDAYEWQPGKQFLIHRADVTVGDDRVHVIEIIGAYDGARQACAMHAFQNDGSHHVMWATVTESGALRFTGDDTRATLTVQPSNATMDAVWERRAGGGWDHWMDMHFEKQR